MDLILQRRNVLGHYSRVDMGWRRGKIERNLKFLGWYKPNRVSYKMNPDLYHEGKHNNIQYIELATHWRIKILCYF
jgi:hypothetical protein